MGFYDLSKEQRNVLVGQISGHIKADIRAGLTPFLLRYFADEDTYMRKTAYLVIGRLYLAEKKLQKAILRSLKALLKEEDPKIRQTAVNAAGEIGKVDF